MTGKELEKYTKLLGQRIKALRLERHLTQEEMEDLEWMSSRSYQDIEAGKVSPRYSSLIAICKKLRVQPRDLLDFDISL